MLELATVGLVLSGAHLAAVYLGTDVLRLEYSQMLALNVGIAVVTSLLLRASMPSWKPRVEAAVKQEARQGEAFTDVGLMFLIFIAGGIGSAVLMYRRYGPVGWAGMIASSALVNWLV
jgi:hypothetical protein